MAFTNALRFGAGGGLGSVLGQILNTHALAEPLLGALGLPKNAQELFPLQSDESTLSTILKGAGGTAYEMATDPLTYAGGLLSLPGKFGKLAKTLGGAGEAFEKVLGQKAAGMVPGLRGMPASLMSAEEVAKSEMGKFGKVLTAVPSQTEQTINNAQAIDKIRKNWAGASVGKNTYDGTVEPGLMRAIGGENKPGNLIDALKAAMGGHEGAIGDWQHYYESQAPDKLNDLLKAVSDPKTYSRTTPAAADLLEQTGMGLKTGEGMQMLGMNKAPNLVKGRGGVLMTPQEQYLSMGKSATPTAASWGGGQKVSDEDRLLSRLLGNVQPGMMPGVMQ